MKNRFKIFLATVSLAMTVSAALAAFSSCTKQPEFVEVVELGCGTPEIVVDASSGSMTFPVIASSEVRAELIEGADWAAIVSERWTGDADVQIDYSENSGRERMAVVRLTSGRRELLLNLIQSGSDEAVFHFAERNVTIPFESGAHSAVFETVIPVGKITGKVIYPDGGSWIEEPVASVNEDGTFFYAVRENLGSTPRTAIIELTSEDNVGRTLASRLYVTQGIRGKLETTPISVAGLRELSAENGDIDVEGTILKPFALTGRVINDNSEGNAAQNMNMSVIIQDLTLSGRTVYLQSSEEGEFYGVKMVFDSEDALSLQRYDLATVSLKGRKLVRHTNPEYYSITGLKAYDIISASAGTSSDVVKREKSINELEDSDINTLLTLVDCQIPFSKGAFVPIDNSRSAIINKYPMPIVDKDGSTIYLLTNTTASWARDGKGIPQGSGSVSGIIVNETCDNFEWNSATAAADSRLQDYVTGIGNIGRYQIRPQTREDMAFNKDAFAVALCEWTSYSDVLNKPGLSYSKPELRDIYPSQDWSSLGPLSGSATGVVSQSDAPAWFGAYWVNTDKEPKLDEYYWQIEFSTADLTAANAPLSVQIAAFNCVGADVGAPRYWWLKYSTDGENWKTLTSSSYTGDAVQYTSVGTEWTYTVPDYPKSGSYRQYHCPGAKNMSFTLPASEDLFGKERVYVRLMPAKNISGYDGLIPISYDGATIRNVKRSCLSYASVRYNR